MYILFTLQVSELVLFNNIIASFDCYFHRMSSKLFTLAATFSNSPSIQQILLIYVYAYTYVWEHVEADVRESVRKK